MICKNKIKSKEIICRKEIKSKEKNGAMTFPEIS